MLVVLAILSLAVAIVAPNFNGSRSRAEQQGFAQTLSAALRTARMRAISRNAEVTLAIDLRTGMVRGSDGGGEMKIPEGVKIDMLTARGELSGDTAGFRIFPDGTASGGSLFLAGSGETQLIGIDWLTGAVTIGHEADK